MDGNQKEINDQNKNTNILKGKENEEVNYVVNYVSRDDIGTRM